MDVSAVTPFVQDADFTLYVGDALEVLRELPDESVHCCVTSPPYLNVRPEYPSPSLQDFELIFRELGRLVTGAVLVNAGRIFRDNCEVRWQEKLLLAAERGGLYHLDTLIWVKPNANPIHGPILADSHEHVYILGQPGDTLNVDAVRRPHAPSTLARNERHWTNHRGVKKARDSRARKTRVAPNPLGARPRSYVAFSVGTDKGNDHPAPMATLLAEHLVALASWPGETVIDPFAGSGTTALVARKLGRKSIGIELSPEYARLAADRLKQLSLFAEASA